ncbi:replication factor C subunit 1-like [Zophobas morio]|uniref:replication factor C subunit 1-like n=1 Tax=Zophobas morio TaxID=2755281 RepID=UPI00308348CD
MDEVDGMSSGDRGGIAELIQLVKHTKVPIICIANDHNDPKIRSLLNHCHDVKFVRPSALAIKGRLMGIAQKEGLKLDSQTLEQMIVSKHSDIRQLLNQLSILSRNSKTFSYDGVKKDLLESLKDVSINPFEAIQKIYSFGENKKMSVNDKLKFYFSNELVPLLSQENFLHFKPFLEGNLSPSAQQLRTLQLVSEAANSFSEGDLVDTLINQLGSWNLMPVSQPR